MAKDDTLDDQVNILLVDDDRSKLLSYEVILADLGERLLSATSARETFEHLLRSDVAVVLMDVQMPDLDGFELAAMIREHPRFSRVAIIFVSAIHLTDLDRLRGYAAGAVDYLPVPIVGELLRAKVRVFVDLHRKTRQLERVNEELERRVAERTAALEASTAQLRDSERRRTLALAAGSMGAWDWDRSTDAHGWDVGQYAIHGVDESFEVNPQSVRSLIHPEDREWFEAAREHALATGEPLQVEFRIVRPDGDIRWCVASGVPVGDGEGEQTALTGVTIDITERKRAEQTLSRLNEELEARVEQRTREREAALAQLFEAQKMETVGQLTGGVAHDFNNLLMAVLGSLELLRKRIDDERGLRLIDNAIKGAERGAALTKRLLAFARRQDLKPEAIDLKALVNGVEELVQRAIGPSIRIEKDLSDGLPSVRADVNQLELAILNLAINARDAMPDGGMLTISAERVSYGPAGGDGLAPGDYLKVCIADTGTGMDAATMAKATLPFFTTKGPGKGTGLGLSMVHGMMAQSGGSLQLASRPGAGTRAMLILPVAAVGAQPAVAPPPLAAEASTLRKCRILVVDDDPLVRTGAAAMVEDLGHQAIEAPDGAAALETLRSGSHVDLVLTDYAMPGMNGVELLRKIKDFSPNIRSILASGYAELANGYLELPSVYAPLATTRLGKPFNQEELSAAIARAVSEEPFASARH
jgi:PAS domain S-box-containing protein